VDNANFISFESPVDEDGTMLGEIMASQDPSSSEQLEDKTLYEEVRQSGLDERELKIINMCTEGLTTREMGERLGISHVAIVKLRKKIREKCKKLEIEIKRSYQN
jgi:DNA-directed RNA polymerase specialized sigma subunit